MAKLNELEIDDYLKQCIELEPEVITEEFSRISADYAYWNERYATANNVLLNAEFEEEKASARGYLKYKEQGDAKKVPTEEAVKSAIRLDPHYGEARMALIGAQHERDHLKGILETLRTKREMLISVGAHLRQEEKGDLHMSEKRALQRSVNRFGSDELPD